ncbi:MAG: hypothetical protein WCF67_09450 [Chitinophagaceae bacterium]
MITHAQYASTEQASDKLIQVPDKFFAAVKAKADKINSRLQRKTEKYLLAFQKREKKLRAKLYRIDSLKANAIFADTDKKYTDFLSRLQAASPKADAAFPYRGHIDSIRTALKFLDSDASLAGLANSTEAFKAYEQAQEKISEALNIRRLLNERQQHINNQLKGLIPVKQLNECKKLLYYYKAQVHEYMNVLNNPSAIEEKVLGLITKNNSFKEFFNKNSLLSSLVSVPQDYYTTANLQGLQTRTGVQQMIQQKIASGGAGAEELISKNLQQAQALLSQWKKDLNGGNDADLPDFKPNSQKVKSFLKRLEFGSNLQTTKSNNYFPATSDLGFSIGYKLSDKNVIGIGVSYKLGLGKDIRHIAFSHEGLGFRTFVDIKLKGSFWLSGGGELNYRSAFSDFYMLKDYSAWQRSALLGLSKKYRISKKVKGNMSVLYDFLHTQHPAARPVVFRIGYGL